MTTARETDPHAMTIMPAWGEVRVCAEPGSQIRFRVDGEGRLHVFVRDGKMFRWPPGTPDPLPGEDTYETKLGDAGVFCKSNNVQYRDHPFTPSPFNSGTCRICALPTRKRWRLEFYRKGLTANEAVREERWFDDEDEAIQERSVLASDPDVIAMGLEEGMYREDPDATEEE
jgi:hypothetical protein